MDRREFLKRTAAALLLSGLGFGIDESGVILRPPKGRIAGVMTRRMIYGGTLFTGYTHGGVSMNEPAKKTRMSQTWFLAGWQADGGLGLQQLL